MRWLMLTLIIGSAVWLLFALYKRFLQLDKNSNL